MDSVYRGGWMGGGGVNFGGGWEAKGGLYHPLEQKQGRCVFNEDGRWQQFDITCSLISVPQWHHILCSGPS